MSSNPLMTKLGGGVAAPIVSTTPTHQVPYTGTTTSAGGGLGGYGAASTTGGGIQFQETLYSGIQGTYNAPVALNPNQPTGGGLRDYLTKVVNEPARVQTAQPMADTGNRRLQAMDDSSGLNFDFKDKIKDSTFGVNSGDGGYAWTNTHTQQQSTILQDRNPKSGVPVPTVTSKLVDYQTADIHGFKQSGGYKMPSGQNSSTFSKEQIEFGDWSEKFRQVVTQNKELKELMITKENALNELRQHTAKLERELQNIMDPLGKSSQLKQKYKETLLEKDKKIGDLELENHNIKKELREATQGRKEAESKLDGIEAKQRQAMYELKLQLEEKARKQMVGCVSDSRSRMRENSRSRTLTATTMRP